MQRHLPAFETFDAHAGARRLPFPAAPAGLATPRSYTAADAGAFLASTGAIRQFMQLHCRASHSS
jgi:hypothetical protein